jgi:hypothetical protein
MLKIFIKDGFVLPSPQVPTRHHENGLPPFFLHSILLNVKILEAPIPAIERKKVSNMIESF